MLSWLLYSILGCTYAILVRKGKWCVIQVNFDGVVDEELDVETDKTVSAHHYIALHFLWMVFYHYISIFVVDHCISWKKND